MAFQGFMNLWLKSFPPENHMWDYDTCRTPWPRRHQPIQWPLFWVWPFAITSNRYIPSSSFRAVGWKRKAASPFLRKLELSPPYFLPNDHFRTIYIHIPFNKCSKDLKIIFTKAGNWLFSSCLVAHRAPAVSHLTSRVPPWTLLQSPWYN
jgi:hypothetical protein